MLRPRFFTALDLDSGSLTLEKEPSRHIAKALRMRVGDTLCLFDGRGREGHGVIEAIERDNVQVRIDSVIDIERESPLTVTLAISLSRGDRVDTIVQKATELGVNTILPFTSERTGVRLEPARLARKRDHWQKIAISACEQCGRNVVPEIHPVASFTELLTRVRELPGLRLLLQPTGEAQPLPPHCESLCLLIGPEGGFSDPEVQAAVDAGFASLQLGPRILRTETAPLAAIAVAQARWGDLLG